MKQNRRAFLIMAAGVGTGVGLLAFLESQSSKGSPDERFESMLAPDGSLPHAQVALVYSRNYNISALGLERLHPFDSRKFGRIRDHLIEKGLRRSADFICPNELTREQLLTIHTPEYLESLKNRDVLSRILEIDLLAWVPEPLLEAQVLQPMRHASGGTLLACRLALKNKICINLGGGYHHADSDHGGGFCVYSDVPVAIKTLRAEGKIRKALIVDTDAHQGNGFANCLRRSGWGSVLDFFDESIYPWPKVAEDVSVPLPAGSSGAYYLSQLEKELPRALERFEPDLVVYNAGSDVLASDPLSSLQLTVSDLRDRDLFVISCVRKKEIPIAMVLAGGYGRESAVAHALSIQAILEKFDS